VFERVSVPHTCAIASIALLLGFPSCGGGKFQAGEGEGGAGGSTSSAGKGSGGKSGGTGGASSGGSVGQGGTIGVSGGSSVGGSGGEPSAGGVPPGGGPSGGSGNAGGPMGGMAGFGVAGVAGIGGGMTVSCATEPECVNCCRETIGNGSFAALAYECGCSPACYDVCLTYCDQGSAINQNCEFCIVSEFQNAASNQLCADDREQCNGNTACTKYVNCLDGCEP